MATESREPSIEQTDERRTDLNPVRYVVFAVLAAGFIAWVSMGLVEARVWSSGKLTFIDKRISGMWQYLGQNLPEMPAPGLVSFMFWLSLLIMVVGTVAGLWLFLGVDDRNPHDDSWEAIHAAHLTDESE